VVHTHCLGSEEEMKDKAMFWAMMATAAVLFWLHCMMLVWERTQGVGQ